MELSWLEVLDSTIGGKHDALLGVPATHEDQRVPWPWRRYIWNLSPRLRGVHTDRITLSGPSLSSRRKSVQPSSEARPGRFRQGWAESMSTVCSEKAPAR